MKWVATGAAGWRVECTTFLVSVLGGCRFAYPLLRIVASHPPLYLTSLSLHRAGVLVDQAERSDDAWGPRALAVTGKRPVSAA